MYESKRLNIKMSESEAYLKANPNLSVTSYVDKLKDYDVISFDVFDTLIFRPFSVPTDLFFLVGESFEMMDFKNIRTWAEWDAREKCKKRNGHMEIGLKEIWENLEKETGLSAEAGMEIERKIEQKLCYANPFMLEVWKHLQSMNKKLIIVSDMYLPEICIAMILENAGFTGIEKIYVSNTYHKSKAEGSLYHEVINDFSGLSIAHVGDNPQSDDKMARKCGITVLPYPNINKNVLLYRPMDMSAIVGSAYRAIVSSHLYNGLHSFGMEYEYGFIYGGLFVVGYCNFIHEYYNHHGLNKLLFLSRDGDILKQVYDFLYPDDSTEYVYWSRKAAVKLMANEDRHDFFRRFLYHKVNQKYTIAQILHSMELDSLTEQLDIKSDEELTDKNVRLLKQFIESKWEQVLAVYEPQITAAKKYYTQVLDSCEKVAAVDIGWAGSGAMSLSHLVEKVWKIPCQVTGIIAGTNTIHNAEPDASEIFLQKGKLAAYLYSQSHNRDLLKKHDPNKDYNVFWELLLSSPTPQFTGFYERKTGEKSSRYLEELDITLNFEQVHIENTANENIGKEDMKKEEIEKERIQKIQEGILAFAHEYHRHFKDFPYMFRISGRDAYAPMLVAASHNERYLKAIEKRFHFEKNII
ncbi:MAG: HAD-IA family hydrolase [Lachnospiraceae bacterium]|nr:HAD-IA family hydrolase [Lachnospiraceae bacterium]